MTEQRPIEPVSWLRLERYHLGELSKEESAEVERALAADSETQACLDEIRKPLALRPLPDTPSRSPSVRHLRTIRARWPLVSFAVAAAAAVALLIRSRTTPVELPPPPRSVHVKGGDVAMTLVRERSGHVDPSPATFAEGDRFKVLLSCPPTLDGDFDVVVFQDGASSFPFDAPSAVACGNDVPLPGAFTLTSTAPATVCVTWTRDPDLGFRRSLSHDGIGATRGAAACVTLGAE